MRSQPLGRAVFTLGRIADRLGADGIAARAYGLAADLAPAQLAWRLRAVRLLQGAGRWDRSRHHVERTLSAARDASPATARELELRWRLGLAETVVGDDAAATEAFTGLVARAGTRAAWRRDLRAGLVELSAERRVQAFATLARLEPTQRAWIAAEARAHDRLSDWRSAAEAWERLIALDPSRAPDHYRLGACYRRLDREDDARDATRVGLSHDPTRRPIDDRMLEGSVKAFRGRRLVAHFVEDHLDEVRAAVADRAHNAADATTGATRHVFVYWAQGFDAAPPIVRRCLERLRELHAPGVLVPLDNTNLHEWIDIPADVAAAASRTPTQYSNLVRVGLLARHGGVWVDATCFATRPLDSVDLAPITAAGFTAFRYRTFRIASWFMRAEPGDPVMVALDELQRRYWQAHDHVISYFMFHDMLEALCLLDERIGGEFERSPIESPSWELTRRMRMPYDAAGYDEVLGRSFIHKLTYKQPEANTEKDTYFAQVLRGDAANEGGGSAG